ncbi:iron-containing alcohol dehydrogenase [Streptomonospora sp. PA3]|uniref:iron-containing alcohol dehydrogenase n=1 Tax=Streptomonospora sp. PA3 TaxID=2607326 RepID=UPI0012DF577E|nr:iron-containing alcohol dehydrogenase [Streptomonospora sp. PA3]MUL43192.1 iron-containing alcohol dehydrogenase [Streptomonospora sp. PA3]
MDFDFHIPTRIHFGSGRLAEIGGLASRLGRKALVVSGRTAMRRAGVLDRIAASLSAAGVESVFYGEVSPDPLAEEADAAAAQARDEGCDVVIGVGGGSAIDGAKAAAVGVVAGPVGPLVGTGVPDTLRALPLIAVPTTAGSGSEVTKGAILTDASRDFKSGIRGHALFPADALIDPELTATLPTEVAVETGFDTFCHAVEGYLACGTGPVNAPLAREAVGIVAESLPAIAAGASTPALRERMAYAALLGGINVATASTCLPHRLQQAMPRLHGRRLSHGRGLAVLYPAWLRLIEPHRKTRLRELAECIGATDFRSGVLDLLDRTGLRSSLADWGFAPDDLAACEARVSGNVANDPTPDTGEAEVRAIYAGSL